MSISESVVTLIVKLIETDLSTSVQFIYTNMYKFHVTRRAPHVTALSLRILPKKQANYNAGTSTEVQLYVYFIVGFFSGG